MDHLVKKVSTDRNRSSIPQRTLVDTVSDGLVEMLFAGELPLGGVVNEAALAERFQVSRGPVREAVKRLQGRGLVVKEPYLKARVVDLSTSDMVELFELREAAEGMSARLAAQAMPDAAVDSLLVQFSDAQARRQRQIPDVHLRIAEHCGNRRVQTLLCDELYHLVRLYRTRSGELPGRREDAFAEHWQILRAIKARDPDLAESLMRSHVARATESLRGLCRTRSLPPTRRISNG